MRRIVILLLLLSSCNLTNIVMRSTKHKEAITRRLKSEGICRPDTLRIVKKDTIMRVDTIGEIYIYSDTIRIKDTIKIHDVKYRDIIKSITITDSVKYIVVDSDAVNALTDINKEMSLRIKSLTIDKRNYIYITALLFFLLCVFIVMAVKK